MLLNGLALLAASALAQAVASPVESILGDWDLGPSVPALRILQRDTTSIAAFFCQRDVLMSNHLCNADVIFNFVYVDATHDFIHDDSQAHTYATLELNSDDPQHLRYSFENDTESGDLTGTRLQ